MHLQSLIERRAGDAFVVALAVASLLEIWLEDPPGSNAGLTVIALFASLPLLLRGRFPFAVPMSVMACLAVGSFFLGRGLVTLSMPIGMVVLANWVMGRSNDRSRAVLGLAAALVCAHVVNANFTDKIYVGDVIFVTMLVVAPWAAGQIVRTRDTQAEELRTLATRLESEQEQRARAAAADERLRIARELHDVVAHSISVMTIQAGAARLLFDEEPESAEEPLLRVEETGRQTLAEMRRLLGVLQSDLPENGLRPRPTFAQLESLFEQFRAAGLAVELTVAGVPRSLPAGLDLAAFRIVQEALTNTLKHAGSSTARVTLSFSPAALELEVEDDGTGAGAAAGDGHGLVGMRERVAIYDGEFWAGPRADGGFVVRARLPLDQNARTEPGRNGR